MVMMVMEMMASFRAFVNVAVWKVEALLFWGLFTMSESGESLTSVRQRWRKIKRCEDDVKMGRVSRWNHTSVL